MRPGYAALLCSLVKNYRPGTIDQNPVFHMKSHGPGKYDPLDVLSLEHHVLDGVLVADLDDVLGNNGPFVKNLRDVMTGCTDHLHAYMADFTAVKGKAVLDTLWACP